MGATWYEPAVTLAYVAAITQRVRLLTHVLVLPHHHPLRIAKQYGTLDALSGGRVILGVGAGHLRPEFQALGADYEERGAITDEYLRALLAVWEDAPASFDGRFVRFRDLHVSPRAVQKPRPPIWIGGNSQRAVRRAVELGDAWVPFEVTPRMVRERLTYAQELSAVTPRVRPLEVVVPASEVEMSREGTHGERAPFSGSKQQIVDDIGAFQEAGVTGMTVSFRAETREEHLKRMQWFAEDIFPAFP
jgi:probable F420-dependent oxidoreductase